MKTIISMVRTILGLICFVAMFVYLGAFIVTFFHLEVPKETSALLDNQEDVLIFGAAVGCLFGAAKKLTEYDFGFLLIAVVCAGIAAATKLIPGGLATAVTERNVAGVVTFVLFFGCLGFAFAARRLLREKKEAEVEHH